MDIRIARRAAFACGVLAGVARADTAITCTGRSAYDFKCAKN